MGVPHPSAVPPEAPAPATTIILQQAHPFSSSGHDSALSALKIFISWEYFFFHRLAGAHCIINLHICNVWRKCESHMLSLSLTGSSLPGGQQGVFRSYGSGKSLGTTTRVSSTAVPSPVFLARPGTAPCCWQGQPGQTAATFSFTAYLSRGQGKY